MVKIIIIKAQPKKKKKSGPDLECYERVERHEIWIDVGKVNLTWQVLEKTINTLTSHFSFYKTSY